MKNIFFFISIILIAFSCKKKEIIPDPILPPPTQEGANTFGCMINGEPWVAEWYLTPPGGFEYLEATYIMSANILQLGARRIKEGIVGGERFKFIINSPNSNSEYVDEDLHIEFHDITLCQRNNFSNSLSFENKLTLSKFDFEDKIVSGSFNAVLINPNCTDTLYVNEGRFDARLRVIQ